MDWNVGRAGADQEATRLFLCYHLLTQGGLDIITLWHTVPFGPEPSTPSQVLARIRQRMTLVSHVAATRALRARRAKNPA